MNRASQIPTLPILTCNNCHNPLPKPSTGKQISRYLASRFCSRRCFGLSIKGRFKTNATLGAGRLRARIAFPEMPSLCTRCKLAAPTDRHHKDGNPLNNSPSNIAFLCRRCHMREDGRLERVIQRQSQLCGELNPNWSPPKICSNCHTLSKPIKKGLCHACNEYQRRHGVPRPDTLYRFVKSPRKYDAKDICLDCGTTYGESKGFSKGRCTLCYASHMQRLRRPIINARRRKFPNGKPLLPPRPCIKCNTPVKPMRRGMCNPCYRKSLRAMRSSLETSMEPVA